MINLKNPINIQPPPYSDNQGRIITPSSIHLENCHLVYIDNTLTKTINIQIAGIPLNILLVSSDEYDNLGDWTRSQLEAKLLEFLGDDPSSKIRSLYPRTLEEDPNHPGTVLAKMIKSLGIYMTDSCSCRRHALEMNKYGNDWCEQNIDTIVGWIREEAKKRNLPFIDAIGKLMIGRAIKKSRKLLANQPVPENDEDLDSV